MPRITDYLITHACPGDQVELIDCDIKCFDHAWSPDDWAAAAETHQIVIARRQGSVVGFAAFVLSKDGAILCVPKVGVKKQFRRKGIGTDLLAEAIAYGIEKQVAQLQMILPESSLPGDGIAAWMEIMGWKSTDIAKNFFPSMGSHEDGFIFRLPIEG